MGKGLPVTLALGPAEPSTEAPAARVGDESAACSERPLVCELAKSENPLATARREKLTGLPGGH